jgi:hypothetical protein
MGVDLLFYWFVFGGLEMGFDLLFCWFVAGGLEMGETSREKR